MCVLQLTFGWLVPTALLAARRRPRGGGALADQLPLAVFVAAAGVWCVTRVVAMRYLV